MPSDSGITSSSSTSSVGPAPASRSAWIAAPSATDLIGIDAAERLLAEELLHVVPHEGHARRAAHEDHAVELLGFEPGVPERAPARDASALEQRLHELIEFRARDCGVRTWSRPARSNLSFHALRDSVSACFTALARRSRTRAPGSRGASTPCRSPSPPGTVGERAIHVVAAERAVAAGRPHLKDAVVEREDRDVERAAAEIVDREVPFCFFSRP